MRLTIGEQDFLLDGRPHRILSGAIHYFRVHPDHWAERIRAARLMGLNTVETYVPWNAHEPVEGAFAAEGGLDLGRFLDLVHAEGMHAIVRPGPYICAEWTNGGLPFWLFADGKVGIRRSDPRYLEAVRNYLAEVARIVVPRQVHRGGPVVLVQVENEYGAYGDDRAYLESLVELHRELGFEVPLTSVDQPIDGMLERGTVPALHATASFGSRAAERLARLREVQPTGPLMCSEFWDGWFDSWGEPHHTTSASDSAGELETLLSAGASVNVYMFHGGTNLGLTNGANHKGTYRPIVTSYDYDAPLDEAGRPTAKFWAFRDVISRHAPVPEIPDGWGETRPVGEIAVTLDRQADLFDLLPHPGAWSAHDVIPSLDALGAATGFALYRREIELDEPAVLAVEAVRDRAQVFLDRRPIGVLERERHERSVPVPATGPAVLDLLVEDLGRVNYGPRIGEQKGIIGAVRLGGLELGRWSATALDLEALAGLEPAELPTAPDGNELVGPAVAAGSFRLEEDGDRHLLLEGFTKGVVWVNGFCLGRYWSRGPQRTLYVPGPVLRRDNRVVVLELHAASTRRLTLHGLGDLGPSEE